MQRLAYAETDQPWGLLAAARACWRAWARAVCTSLGTHRTQLEEAMRGLEAAVGAMRAAVDTRQRVDAAAAGATAGSVAVDARVAGVGPRRADRAHV